MRTIRIGFSSPTSWKPFAELIKLVYGIPYDHVYIRIHSESIHRDLIYQASGIQVNFMSPQVFDSSNKTQAMFETELSDESYVRMLQFAVDQAGKSYGVKEAIGLGIVRIAELFGRKISNPFRDGGKTWVCSELAGFILEDFAKANIDGDKHSLSPPEVYDYCVKFFKRVL